MRLKLPIHVVRPSISFRPAPMFMEFNFVAEVVELWESRSDLHGATAPSFSQPVAPRFSVKTYSENGSIMPPTAVCISRLKDPTPDPDLTNVPDRLDIS